MKHLEVFSTKTGLAFPVIDDVLDEIGDEKKLGKKVGKDKDKNKCTYPAVYGIEKSKEIARELTTSASAELIVIRDLVLKTHIGKTDMINNAYEDLTILTDFILQRIH